MYDGSRVISLVKWFKWVDHEEQLSTDLQMVLQRSFEGVASPPSTWPDDSRTFTIFGQRDMLRVGRNGRQI